MKSVSRDYAIIGLEAPKPENLRRHEKQANPAPKDPTPDIAS